MLKLRSKSKLSQENLDHFIDNIDCFEEKAIFTNHDELPDRIVAVGDIHGDLEALFTILLNAEVINIKGEWKARNTFVVQTGDIFDKGRNISMLQRVGIRPDINDDYYILPEHRYVAYDIIDHHGNVKTLRDPTITLNEPFGQEGDEIIILKFLADLNTQAQRGQLFGNSRVLLCSGNHEISNVLEYLDDNYDHAITHGYIHPMDTLLFGGPEYPKRKELLTIGSGLLAKKLACMLNVVVVVGDFIFCHGGLNSHTLRDINNIQELDSINNMFRRFLLGDSSINLSELKKYISMENSITWFRGQGENIVRPAICEDTIDMFTHKFRNPNYNLVIGHSIQGLCQFDEKSRLDKTIPRTRFSWDRTNVDGTVDTCITLPNSRCNHQIYRIDTAISRMNGTPDYQYPVSGRLNSLIIDLNRDGSKRSVLARNSILGDIQMYPPPHSPY